MSRTDKWEEFLSANCDGSGPHRAYGVGLQTVETRRLPTGAGSGLILCYGCFEREMRYRVERNRELSPENAFRLPRWEDLPVYATAANTEVKPVTARAEVGCKNCHTTERNLAQAYLRIERLIAAERNLSLAETRAEEAQQDVLRQREVLYVLRKETAAWLEEQR